MLWSIRQCENMDKATFEGVGKYEVPQLLPVVIDEPIDMIGFNFAAKHKHPEQVGVHFFLKDYQFTRLWTSPDIYTAMLRRFRFVCTPDFSMFTDFPLRDAISAAIDELLADGTIAEISQKYFNIDVSQK